VPQLSGCLLDRPRIKAAVMQPRADVSLVGMRRQLVVHGVRIIGGVADLIGMPTPHNTQCAFLDHALPLSLRQDIQQRLVSLTDVGRRQPVSMDGEYQEASALSPPPA
jgi:DNA-binding cell septation regulator SpoVG